MPFHPTSEQKQLIRDLILMAEQYRDRNWYDIYHPIAISIPTGAEHLWCEQIEQILANHKIYVTAPEEETE